MKKNSTPNRHRNQANNRNRAIEMLTIARAIMSSPLRGIGPRQRQTGLRA